MKSATAYDGTRELDFRSADGLEVALLWHTESDVLSVIASDTRTGRAFELVLGEGDDPLDVFNHPYAYAAHRGLAFDALPDETELAVAA